MQAVKIAMLGVIAGYLVAVSPMPAAGQESPAGACKDGAGAPFDASVPFQEALEIVTWLPFCVKTPLKPDNTF